MKENKDNFVFVSVVTTVSLINKKQYILVEQSRSSHSHLFETVSHQSLRNGSKVCEHLVYLIVYGIR